MDSRLSDIITILSEKRRKVSIKSLANDLKVSERTIYTDIKKLNNNLGTLNYPQIINENGFVLLSEELPDHINNVRLKVSAQHRSYDRQLEMLEFILLHKKSFTTDDLIERFYISRSTVLKDISLLRKWLKVYSVSITTVPFQGYIIDGDEIAIRNALINFLSENDIQVNTNYQMYNKLEEFLLESTLNMNVEISDESFDKIILALTVVYYRVKLGFNIEPKSFPHILSNEEKYFINTREELSNIFNLNILEPECRYIAMKFSESSILGNDLSLSEKWITLTLMTKYFIEKVAEKFDFNMFISDQMLFKGILNHLRPAYKRAKMHEWIKNPLYDYVTENHSRLHNVVVSNIKKIEKELGVIFTPNESSFFTLLFASSYERNKSTMNAKPRIIIVCHAGMSTSEILRSKIVTNFYVDVKGTFSVRKAEIWLEKNEVDLIISTVEFIHQTIPSIQVNPYLSKNDKNLIQNELRQVTVPVNIDQLIKTIEKNAVIENKIELKKDLNSYFGITSDINESKGVYQPMLLEVLNEDTVSVNVECSNRNEAVIESGKLLVKAGYAEERYIQAMIDNVLKNGTYIVIAPGIAMPHARPEEGAKEIGLSIVTLKEPVVFGHPTNDPVKIVVGLCAVDHQTHLKALSELVDILGDSLKVEKLNKAENTKEVMEIIKGGN